MPTSSAYETTVPTVPCTLITTPIQFNEEEDITKSDIGVHLDTGRVSILKRFPNDVSTTCSSFSTLHKKKAENMDAGDRLKILKAVRNGLFRWAMRMTAYMSLFLVLLCFLLYWRSYTKKQFRNFIKPHVYTWLGDYILKPFHLYALRSTKKVSSFQIFMSLFIIGCSLLLYWIVHNMQKLTAYNKEMKDRVKSMKEYSFNATTRKYDSNSDSKMQSLDYIKVYKTMPLSTFMLTEGLNSRKGNADILYQVITYIQSQEQLKGLFEKFCKPYLSLLQADSWLRILIFQSKLKAVQAVVTSIQAETEHNLDGNTYDDKIEEIGACIEQLKTRRVDELITCYITLHSLKSEWTHWVSKEVSTLSDGKNDFVECVSESEFIKKIKTSIEESITSITSLEKNAVERVRTVLAFVKDLTNKTIDDESDSNTDTTSNNKNDSSAALSRSKDVYTKYYIKAMNLICSMSKVLLDDNANILISLACTIREMKCLYFVLEHKQSLLTYLRKPMPISNPSEYHKEKHDIDHEDAKVESYYGGHPNELRTYDSTYAKADHNKFRTMYPHLAAAIEDYMIDAREVYGLKTRESGLRAITNNVRIFRLVQQCHLIVRRLKFRCCTKMVSIVMAQLAPLDEKDFKCSKASDYLLIKDTVKNVKKTHHDWGLDEEIELGPSYYQQDAACRLINGKCDASDEYWEYKLFDFTEKTSNKDDGDAAAASVDDMDDDLNVEYIQGTKYIDRFLDVLIPKLTEKIKKAYSDSLPKREEMTMEDIYIGNTVTWLWSVPDAEIEWTWPVNISEETTNLTIINVANLGMYGSANDFVPIIQTFVGQLSDNGTICERYMDQYGWRDDFGVLAQVSGQSLYNDRVLFHFSDFDKCLNFYKRMGGNLSRSGYYSIHNNGVATIHTDPEYHPLKDPEFGKYRVLYQIDYDLKVKDINSGTGNLRSMNLENLVRYNKEFDHAPAIVAFPSTTRLGGNYRLHNKNSGSKHQIWKFIDVEKLRRRRYELSLINREDLLPSKQPPPAIVDGKPALYHVRAGAQASVDLPEGFQARIASGYDYFGPFFIFGPFGQYTSTHSTTSRRHGLTSTLEFPGKIGEETHDMDYSNF
jgi:hypothetical protein